MQGVLQRGGAELRLRPSVHARGRGPDPRRARAGLHRGADAPRRRADGAGEPARARAVPQAVRGYETEGGRQDAVGVHGMSPGGIEGSGVALAHRGDGRVPSHDRCLG